MKPPGAHGRELGRLLKDWRARRGLSQLDLAAAARTTQRHLSFLESGRAAPSRAMVLRLGETLALPLRQQNALLLAAGYAPAWPRRDLAAPALAAVNRALDHMLGQHEPYPAFVIDRDWTLLRANQGALRLSDFLTGAAAPDGELNLAVALLDPGGLRPCIVNWPEVARHVLAGVQADARADARPETAALLARLTALPGVADLPETGAAEAGDDAGGPILPIHFRRHGRSLRLFTAIATLGTPRDVTLDEIRIEFFFPMDEPTTQFFTA